MLSPSPSARGFSRGCRILVYERHQVGGWCKKFFENRRTAGSDHQGRRNSGVNCLRVGHCVVVNTKQRVIKAELRIRRTLAFSLDHISGGLGNLVDEFRVCWKKTDFSRVNLFFKRSLF